MKYTTKKRFCKFGQQMNCSGFEEQICQNQERKQGGKYRMKP